MPERKHILLTVPHLSAKDSPFQEMMAIARFLPKDSYRLTICAFRGADDIAQVAPELEALGVSRVFLARYRAKRATLKEFKRFFADISTINQHGPYDLQHSLDFSTSPIEAIAAKRGRRPYVFSQRDLALDHPRLVGVKARLSTKVIAISEQVRKRLLALGVSNDKIWHADNGIDAEETRRRSEPNITREPHSILCVGHIFPRKRQEDAIRALAMIKRTIPDVRLRIAGLPYDRQYTLRLERLVDELQLNESVEFLGSRKDIVPLMQKSSALILCSDSEAVGMVLLEAMVAGTPVVASEAIQNVIVPGETGFLVPVGDTEGYAAALTTILTDQQTAASLAARAESAVEERFSAKRMVERYVELYDSLTGGSVTAPEQGIRR